MKRYNVALNVFMCMCVRECVRTRLLLLMSIFMHACAYLYGVNVYAFECICARVLLCVCVFSCIYVCTYVFVNIYLY